VGSTGNTGAAGGGGTTGSIGACITGNSNVTYTNTGTRNGAIT
jgi:hypothetical protein